MTSPHKLRTRTLVGGGALVLAGFAGGAALAAGGVADAASSVIGTREGTGDVHPGETPLTGSTAAKVRAAALAKYPGATVDRVETDSEGAYEAHIVTKAGEDLVVQVGKDFAVTGTQPLPGRGGADHDGFRPDDDASPSGSAA
jgi:hypothetical protein